MEFNKGLMAGSGTIQNPPTKRLAGWRGPGLGRDKVVKILPFIDKYWSVKIDKSAYIG